MIERILKQIWNALVRGFKWVVGTLHLGLLHVRNSVKNIGRWFTGIWWVYCSTQSRVRVFYGFGHWWLAKKYADKRMKMSKINKFAGGQQHVVYPFGGYTLIVFNHNEMDRLKARGIFNKKMDFIDVLKNSYYIARVDNNTQNEVRNIPGCNIYKLSNGRFVCEYNLHSSKPRNTDVVSYIKKRYSVKNFEIKYKAIKDVTLVSVN